MLRYDMSDMRGADGLSLWYQVESALVDQVSAIQKKLQEDDHYLGLCRKLPSRHVEAYFKMAIRSDIYDAVREACVIEWYKREKTSVLRHETSVRVPRAGVFRLLKDSWIFDGIDLVLEDPVVYYMKRPGIVISTLRQAVKMAVEGLRRKGRHPKAPMRSASGAKIGCHYTEGIQLDPRYRSDIEWTLPGGVDPKDVVLYMTDFDTLTGRPFSRDAVRRMEEMGFQWVSLDHGAVEDDIEKAYVPNVVVDSKYLSNEMTGIFSVRRWIQDVWNSMVRSAFYWRGFFTDFNIRVLFIPEYTTLANVSQSVAFDLDAGMHGVIVGVQRSEILHKVSEWDTYGCFNKDILFIWGDRTRDTLFPNGDTIEKTPVSGYPFRRLEEGRREEPASAAVRRNGARFVIAVFDEAPVKDAPKAMQEIASFYRSLIDWMLNDREVGLIIKSKKPAVQKGLDGIAELIKRAAGTGRCINVKGAFGMRPMSVIEGVDMVAGFNISTAVIESVINGVRGVIYDSERLVRHVVYRWGKGKIVFDRLDDMIGALKSCKSNGVISTGLGDWTAHIDEIDPFRDGQYHMRVARYMKWLIEAFDSGNGREEAIEYAERQYRIAFPMPKNMTETLAV